MTDSRNAKLIVTADTTGVTTGFDKVESDARKMSREVKKSSDEAAKGLKGFGDEAKKQGDQFKGMGEEAKKHFKQQGEQQKEASKQSEHATNSIIASIQRTTAAMQAGAKGSAKYFETLATQRGVSADVLKPYLDGLRAVEAAQGKVGMSARATAAAMRGVPAQFTDIIVSLQGGQAPLTVLLQQGGQLKDVFGGVGNAARALGGYVAGLVNPFTVAAAGVGVLGLAYFQGSKEADNFRKALLLTGNAAGASTAQLAGLAESVSAGFGTTVGRAAEAITALANAGGVGRASLGEFAATAIAAEKAFGIAATDIAKNFADLGKDPTAASLKLNESMNFLTASTFEQIKAAQDLGQQSKAAALAQDAYNAALKGRSAEVVSNAGTIEKAWAGITSGAKAAWDAMLGVGRPTTIGAQLGTAQKNLEAALAQRKTVGDDSAFAPALDKEIAKLKEQVGYVTELDRIQKRAGDSAAERVAREAAGIKAQQDGLKYLTAEQKMRNEIAQQTATMVKAGFSQVQIEERIAQIRASYAPKGGAGGTGGGAGESELAGLRARVATNNEYLASLQATGEQAKQATEAERQVAKIKEELTGSIKGAARANKEAALAAAERIVQQEKEIALEQLGIKILQDSGAERAKLFDVESKRTATLGDELEKQLQQNAAFGLSAEALGELTAKRYDDAAAATEQRAATLALIDPQIAQELTKQAEALRALAAAKRAGGALQQGQNDDKAAIDAAKKAISEYDALVGRIDTAKLSGMFNGAVDGALQFATALSTVGDVATKTQAALAANAKINAGDGAKRAAEEARILAQSASAQINAYGNMAAGLKSYAKEGSKAYDALHNAEKVFRAFELASAVKNMATKSGLLSGFVGAKVAGDQLMAQSATTASGTEASAALIAGQAKAVSGVAGQANGDPYSAFPRMAAMAGIMAGLGFIVGGIGGGGGGGAAPTNSGRGTVFGDRNAQSESLGNSIDLLNDTQDLALNYTKAMAASLRSIEQSIGGVTNIFLRTGGTSALTDGITTGRLDTGLSDAIKNPLISGVVGLASTLIPGVGNLITNIFGKRVKITGSGISADDQALGDILANGFEGNTFADVQTKRLGRRTRTRTELGDLDPALEAQITAIFEGIGGAIGSAADLLGQDALGTQQKLQDYVVSIGRVDLKDLKGDEIAEKLSAVFGAEADKIAASVVPGFEKLQQVGEGYFETLTRVATQFELVGVYTTRLGDSLGAVGTAGAIAADSLVGLFGGLDAFQSAIQDYYEGFYTEAERTAQTSTELNAAFGRLGQTLPTTVQGYRDLVNAQDLTTEAGRETYAALIQLSPAFKQVSEAAAEAAQAIADERGGLEDRLLQAQGSTAAIRARELAALDPSNRALLQRIFLLQDEEAALTRAVQNTDAALQAVRKATDAEKQLVQARVSAAQQQVAAVKSVFDILDTAVKNLLGNTASSAQAGQDFITNALGAARTTGYLPDAQDLQAAITAATSGLSRTVFATAADQEAERLNLAARLADLKDLTGDQLTEAEKLLKTNEDQLSELERIYTQAQEQVNVLRGIDTGIKTIPEALALLNTSLTAELRAVATAAAAGSASAAAAAARQPYSVNDTPAQRQAKVEAQTGVKLATSDPALVAAAKVLYQSINGGASAAAYNAAAAAVGGDIARAVGWDGSREGAENLRKIYGFANGGYYPGGLALVGEDGPEVINFDRPGQVYTAAQSANLLGGNTQRLEALVEGLTQEVQRLQALTQDGNRELRRTADATNGSPEQPMLVTTL